MMKPTLLRTTLAAAALLGVAALAGCSNNDDTSEMPGMGSSASPSAATSGSTSTSAQFNDADVQFAQMMIVHHEQAVEMSDVILSKKGVNPEVTALAEQIKAAQQPEIDTMKSWLTTWGRESMSGHEMGNGQMTEEEMKALDEADGPTGQKLFLQGMIKHHQGAIQMAQNEITGGRNPDAIALARNIVDSQQKEIATMNGLLAKL
jgi:uncharacterized protein (DUF305 family)